MNKQEASLLLMKKVIVPRGVHIPNDHVSLNYVATFNTNLMALGFTLSLDVMNACAVNLTEDEFLTWAIEVQELLIKYNGSRTNMKPMYPDFPHQVMDMDETVLHRNALFHYITNGTWLPQYEEKIKLHSQSIVKPKVIDLTNDKELMDYVKILAESPVSMSSQQQAIFTCLINEYKNTIYLESYYSIPNKENLAFVIHEISKLQYDFPNTWYQHLAFRNVNTITDVLRIAIEFAGGDSSLSEKCTLRSLKRKDRRFLLSVIDKYYANNPNQVLEDTARHQNLWKVVLKILHPGDYPSKYIYANQFATKVREEKLRTWYSKLDKAYRDNDLNKVIALLEKRPGEFARRLERTIRLAIKLSKEGEDSADVMLVINSFSSVAHKVDRTILLQLHAYFKKQFNAAKNDEEINCRTFFPKGQMSKAYVIEEDREPLSAAICLKCIVIMLRALRETYKTREKLGNVYIDPQLKGYTVPLKLRNASNQLHTISRGSRIALPEEANIIRLYTWWKNTDNRRIDVDLSASFYDEEFNRQTYAVSYMNLRTDGCYHSGDITSAPNGAAEFVDVDINTLLDRGVRYVVMHLNNFTGVYYSEMPECFAGAMVLNELHENEKVFDPAKSIFRSDISMESEACIPVVFDLKTKEVVWIDSVVPTPHSVPNNIEHCKCATGNLIRAILTAPYPNLYDLINFNVVARDGEITSKEDADIIFSLDEGITPYDLEIINKEWI